MDIYSYRDYRTFLRDYFATAKEKNPIFSHRWFARVAGFQTSSFLKMVMEGKRNFTPSSINKCAKGLKLTKRESAYFEALVLFNQAVTEKEKDYYFDRLSALRPAVKLTGMAKDQYEFLTQRHVVVLREMTSLAHFREDHDWIAHCFHPPLKPKEVQHGLEVLLRLGLIGRDAQGRIIPAEASLTTPPEVDAVQVYQYHRDMLNAAKEALFNVPAANRDVTALTVPISQGMLPRIKDKIQALREELMDLVNQPQVSYDDVYQVNIQVFPMTFTKKEGK